MRILAALDSELAELQRQEAEGAELPLPVRRFRAYVGEDTAIAAMQRATAELLRSYGEAFGPDSRRISATRLCQLCGIELDGRLPSRSSGPKKLSASRPLPKHHFGSLQLDSVRPRIRVASDLDYFRARVTVGHEIGHYLIHNRGAALDPHTTRLPSSPSEEALSEYSSRLLLLPDAYRNASAGSANVMSECMRLARGADVTLHAAAARLGDPDSPLHGAVAGVILWRLDRSTPTAQAGPARFTPAWHLCSSAFIPIGRCYAREGSLIACLGARDGETVTDSRVEAVNIGSLKGSYRVDAVAWGSLARGTRCVAAAFMLI